MKNTNQCLEKRQFWPFTQNTGFWWCDKLQTLHEKKHRHPRPRRSEKLLKNLFRTVAFVFFVLLDAFLAKMWFRRQHTDVVMKNRAALLFFGWLTKVPFGSEFLKKSDEVFKMYNFQCDWAGCVVKKVDFGKIFGNISSVKWSDSKNTKNDFFLAKNLVFKERLNFFISISFSCTSSVNSCIRGLKFRGKSKLTWFDWFRRIRAGIFFHCRQSKLK